MLQVLSEEQGCELMEQVPRSLVLCAGRSTGDTARGDKVLEALAKLSADTAARIDVAVVEDVGHHMHCVRSAPRPCFVRSLQHSDLSRPFSTLLVCSQHADLCRGVVCTGRAGAD